MNNKQEAIQFLKEYLPKAGFDLNHVEYNEEYSAIVVEYTTSRDEVTAEDVAEIFEDDMPVLAGGLLEAVQRKGDQEIHQRLITFVNFPEGSEAADGIRWQIELEWAREAVEEERIEALFQRVADTLTGFDEEGSFKIESEMTVT